MQKFVVFLLCGCMLAFFAPVITNAGGFVPCGGPEQVACQSCHVVSLTNNIITWLILILGTIAAIIIVVAGIKLVTSGGNRAAMESAKNMMTNVIIGYLIVLGAWLVVDYGLKALLVQDGAASFGVWNEVECKAQAVPGKNTTKDTLDYKDDIEEFSGYQGGQSSGGGASGSWGSGGGTTGSSGSTGGSTGFGGGSSSGGGAGGGVQCSPNNRACSVSALQAAGMSLTQANVMSCIAMTESSGNPNARSNSSTACGTFQVIRGTWNGAATGACVGHSNCTNAVCNARVAATLVRQSGYSSWTCPGCNSKARSCVNRFSR